MVHLNNNHSKDSISTASFLPNDVRLSVRPKGGIETLSKGYLFRFGSSTTFQCNKESIEMFSGSLFIRSRNFQNSIRILGPEISLKIAGAGSCLIEVEKNGGFKCVGLLGSLRLFPGDSKSTPLLPGELLFTQLNTKTLSDKMTVDLENLFSTSFLISGFSNSSSFEEALRSVAASQKMLIGKSYNATVANTQGADTFEIVTQPNALSPTVESNRPNESISLGSGYKLPEESPLDELLGRSPKRIDPSAVSPNPRPFPSRLLRAN